MSKRELYRDPYNGKIAGVCAGLANYFGLEVWLVRILVITAALLGGTFLVLVAYVAMALMLEKLPKQYREDIRSQQAHTLKSKPWAQGQAPKELLYTLDRDLSQVETRIRSVEAYVTSEAFKVNREFRKL
ncbi:envelope stress response membrane protein PspC [Vibrio cholerae]|uniref:envelope stress response membrane protein PspC n=1 Tax=Vibrio cholerae TaxID=666 RepID=UPI00163B7151|nr:envelope stress response membrane protein PspC [Vibrio cholerae]EJL6357392.1 envelope stress response membrane protein PspC [Vibrio cholerae]ELJ8555491.1 envelope stress response membrane protein PspC [Vibrio cholerae]ELJ8722810.1 envelope stress response membrane protein PspC [Vibrio cholerae]ELP3386655.1 envelope stress response membrane protein PspC [Vibrio cholerae]ELR9909471.1 envelope stress response membrane protein PspC [Vibrio cholerae]